MKKLILVLILGLVLGLGMVTSASATVISLTTADNWDWVWANPNWSATGPNYKNWMKADSLSYDVDLGQSLDLYFAVMNGYQTSGNPAGFLAQITTNAGYFLETGKNKLLSDTTHWEIAVVPYATWPVTPPNLTGIPVAGGAGITPTFNPTTDVSGWTAPTSYLSNISGGNAWSYVSGIDNDALWLWTNKNFNWDGHGQTNMDMLAVLHTTVTPIPEPASLSLLGLGLAGLLKFRRKSYKVTT